jgi:hypothetical protein
MPLLRGGVVGSLVYRVKLYGVSTRSCGRPGGVPGWPQRHPAPFRPRGRRAGSRLLTSWLIALFPGRAIFTAVMAFNLLGDGLRDALDPRMKVLS